VFPTTLGKLAQSLASVAHDLSKHAESLGSVAHDLGKLAEGFASVDSRRVKLGEGRTGPRFRSVLAWNTGLRSPTRSFSDIPSASMRSSLFASGPFPRTLQTTTRSTWSISTSCSH
jgi:hypothetical protein